MTHRDEPLYLEKRYLEGTKYTLFGRWLYFICQVYLGTTRLHLAQRAGLHPSTMSMQIRQGENNPSPESIEKLIAVMQEIAQEKHVSWNPEWRRILYTAANHALPEDVMATEQALSLALQQAGIETCHDWGEGPPH